MPMQKNRCAHCNAPLAEGTSFCEYCDLNRQGASRAASAKPPRRFAGRSILKMGLGVVGLTCCAPTGILVTLYEKVYAIQLDAPKYSARPPPLAQRPTEPIAAMNVFLDMRDASDRSLSQRKQEWREKYEGRWVSWKGTVEELHPYDAFASELVLRPEPGQEFKVQVNFDPLHNVRLNQLQTGQQVHVSGRLWGYYFMGDTVRLSEGALVEQDVPGQAQEHPQ
ncbi:hypothetical protein NR798_23845 [Archangium gephyra]|uniref:hypothetical protein n=1 Tax=Archangium gephyra TaxID=48 RepID=UPI0035D4AB44